MSKFYFTFGFGQEHQNGFHVIEADEWLAARMKMFERFENKWSMQYTETEWVRDGVSQQKQYGLHEVVKW